MKIHPEGFFILVAGLLLLGLVNVIVIWLFKPASFLAWILPVASFLFYCFLLWFFRNPDRAVTPADGTVLCPADGKVVVVEKAFEGEYFKDERIQVSVFMSPLNVHINRYPINGEVVYSQYHPGKYMVAWHPKSSTENERTTVVLKDYKGREILVRQIAGAVARRIVCYAKSGENIAQGDELGFIKFGSRVDLFLPLDTEISVKEGDIVKGNIDLIAKME